MSEVHSQCVGVCSAEFVGPLASRRQRQIHQSTSHKDEVEVVRNVLHWFEMLCCLENLMAFFEIQVEATSS